MLRIGVLRLRTAAVRLPLPSPRNRGEGEKGHRWAGYTQDYTGGIHMALAVNAGARLDRLPISSFHYRIFWLVGAGMFFDGYDLYIAGGVLASTVQSKFSTVPQNLQFISLTFVGMTLGALITGFVGDKMGRRFTYQINLLIFGL